MWQYPEKLSDDSLLNALSSNAKKKIYSSNAKKTKTIINK